MPTFAFKISISNLRSHVIEPAEMLGPRFRVLTSENFRFRSKISSSRFWIQTLAWVIVIPFITVSVPNKIDTQRPRNPTFKISMGAQTLHTFLDFLSGDWVFSHENIKFSTIVFSNNLRQHSRNCIFNAPWAKKNWKIFIFAWVCFLLNRLFSDLVKQLVV